eukprot:TRINITY_DN1925_c2_g2_i1.p1 TRINITY_DN1925_c2_g2~~TRINITY_DN1925_c2_g2_i1.p1  ORF type:complete len:595 (-),score=178.14 TRINITY_DN1925_c2_g2_i1:48-1832(-)
MELCKQDEDATPAMKELHVESTEALAYLCQLLAGSTWLALDTEFIREKTYYPVFCLLQVCNGAVAATVDVLALHAHLDPLVQILYDQRVLKIFHAPSQDLEIFHKEFGDVPRPLFDTQLAAMALGKGYQKSYGDLVKHVLGIHLEKKESRTDWAARPLRKAQIRYALDDVVYLGPLRDRLHGMLAERGREHWLADDFEELANPATYAVKLEDAWTGVKRTGALKGKERAVLQAMARWREAEAQRCNKPRKWVLKDETLVDLARIMPRSLAELRNIQGISENILRRHGSHMLSVIQHGMTRPAEDFPDAPEKAPCLSAHQECIVDLLSTCLKLIAGECHISSAGLCSKRDLGWLVKGSRDLAVLKGWRRSLAGEQLLEVLGGKWGVGMVDGKMALIPLHALPSSSPSPSPSPLSEPSPPATTQASSSASASLHSSSLSSYPSSSSCTPPCATSRSSDSPLPYSSFPSSAAPSSPISALSAPSPSSPSSPSSFSPSSPSSSSSPSSPSSHSASTSSFSCSASPREQHSPPLNRSEHSPAKKKGHRKHRGRGRSRNASSHQSVRSSPYPSPSSSSPLQRSSNSPAAMDVCDSSSGAV